MSVACPCKRQFRQLTESAASDGEPGEMRAGPGVRRGYAECGFERLRVGEHNCAGARLNGDSVRALAEAVCTCDRANVTGEIQCRFAHNPDVPDGRSAVGMLEILRL